MRRCGWLVLLALLVPLVATAQPARPKVVVVKSAGLAPYAAVVAGFSAEVRAEVSEVTLEDSAQAAGRAFQRIAAQKPALVLAIGPLAANTARRSLGKDVPVLFAMVPYYEKYGLEGPNITGIALTSDFRPELAALKALAPSAKRVGILHDPRYSTGLVEAAQTAAGPLGLSVVPLEADAQAKAEKVLAGSRDKVDALLMVADKTVGNASVVQELIAFASAQHLPLVGLTPSQVKEGATLALAPSPTAIGQQAGRLANRIIHEKVDPGALAVSQPEGLDLAVNLSAAGKLGGSRDVVLELLRFAAKRDFPVRVFE
ncbi:ABC transporter substrate-binding protein [Vitiosangium sp. GDMCC 1.1324]|uniref:ABC transporter substrate-binding protein n=1 Tax=Vitiosangium sp. (strain GDMCC 1.1324) TaxID=2138576 RepID=UPI000D36151D|nr:ABC transporter substrate binding protein [Vitiosangium sp. GDMCC 1.1324]PTL77903.1 ABC transporter substrate-binding protein [Vitiosangium sp. GDMCC 1.1324]